jgi:hypothetical protein
VWLLAVAPIQAEATTKFTKNTKNCIFRGTALAVTVPESRGEFPLSKVFFVLFVSFVVASP